MMPIPYLIRSLLVLSGSHAKYGLYGPLYQPELCRLPTHMNFRSGITHESPGLVLCLYLITSVALVDI